MSKAILTMFLAIVSSNAMAEPITFKCTNSKGIHTADLVVDIEKKTVVWGNIKFAILATDEFYMAAIRAGSGNIVGGEVFVQNRYTGDYLHTGIYGARDDAESILKKYPGKQLLIQLAADALNRIHEDQADSCVKQVYTITGGAYDAILYTCNSILLTNVDSLFESQKSGLPLHQNSRGSTI